MPTLYLILQLVLRTLPSNLFTITNTQNKQLSYVSLISIPIERLLFKSSLDRQAFGKLQHIFATKISQCLKAKIFDYCMLSLMNHRRSIYYRFNYYPYLVSIYILPLGMQILDLVFNIKFSVFILTLRNKAYNKKILHNIKIHIT